MENTKVRRSKLEVNFVNGVGAKYLIEALKKHPEDESLAKALDKLAPTDSSLVEVDMLVNSSKGLMMLNLDKIYKTFNNGDEEGNIRTSDWKIIDNRTVACAGVADAGTCKMSGFFVIRIANMLKIGRNASVYKFKLY